MKARRKNKSWHFNQIVCQSIKQYIYWWWRKRCDWMIFLSFCWISCSDWYLIWCESIWKRNKVRSKEKINLVEDRYQKVLSWIFKWFNLKFGICSFITSLSMVNKGFYIWIVSNRWCKIKILRNPSNSDSILGFSTLLIMSQILLNSLFALRTCIWKGLKKSTLKPLRFKSV